MILSGRNRKIPWWTRLYGFLESSTCWSCWIFLFSRSRTDLESCRSHGGKHLDLNHLAGSRTSWSEVTSNLRLVWSVATQECFPAVKHPSEATKNLVWDVKDHLLVLRNIWKQNIYALLTVNTINYAIDKTALRISESKKHNGNSDIDDNDNNSSFYIS